MEQEPAKYQKSRTLGKPSETDADGGGDTSSLPKKRRSSERTCVHKVAVPTDYVSTKDEALHGTLSTPIHNGNMAKTFPFTLDRFQHLRRKNRHRRIYYRIVFEK